MSPSAEDLDPSSSSHDPSAAPSPVPNSTSSRRIPPPCWTHEETLALLDSYRHKWYALHRGNLRASHWQEVADAVARICATIPSATPKTSVQCRHKIEKLRRRYRSERTRSLSRHPSGPPTSSWVYFRIIDHMEHGPPSSSPPPSSDDDDDEDPRVSKQARSVHHLRANGAVSASPLPTTGLGFTVPKAVRSKIGYSRSPSAAAPSSGARFFFKGYTPGAAAEELRRRVARRPQMERKRNPVTASTSGSEVAAALRALSDGFMRVESMKMEMAKEMEEVRLQMELNRTEMIFDTQRRVVDAFFEGLVGRKRAKILPDS